jgi:hypothetical protein
MIYGCRKANNFSAGGAESADTNTFSLRDGYCPFIKVAWDSDLVVAKYCIHSIGRQGFFSPLNMELKCVRSS